ncbi:hypothetical protein PILCRDRAFT_3224 [Piloderma croceum F 1598]|uniref:Uncharacterized protein n=1 Tax=Piloderma croceum (strain F 1598) TaxID=765440 RepID=A0A0C3FUX6_PILCF|nr:hypothetical protein PILCRDRAFT_3224 [Piloderma croceum F 1598]
MGVTKEEDRNQRVQEEKDGPTKQALLLLAISGRLGLTVNGVPNPRLGIISSPRHKDHPLLWMEWAAKEKKRGSTKAPSEDADRHARQRRGQIITMGIIAQTRQYNEFIAQGGLTVLPTPSWDVIEFSPSMDEMECAGHLASRGVTTTEVCDASQYAYTWLEHSDETDVVSKPSASTNKGGTTTLSLTGSGTPGLQPHNTAVPPATTVAGNAPTGDILDENVDMEEPRDKEDPSCVMETDTT